MNSVLPLLQRLVSFDSVFGHEQAIGKWLADYLRREGFDVGRERVGDGRFNLLARRGEGTAPLLCYGHIDTVPVYEGWDTDPFSLTPDGDKLFGLGACDMKGGIAALLDSVERLPRSIPIKLLLAVDEENASAGAWRVATQRTDWLQGVEHILSVEPGASADRIGGADVLTLGRRGRARFKISVKGFSAHGGHVDKGVNAIDIASRIAREIADAKPAFHERLKEGSQYVASISASAEGLSIPERCELEIERHLVIPETVDTCLNELNQICDDVVKSLRIPLSLRRHVVASASLVPRQNKYMEPYEIDENDSLVESATSAIQTVLQIPKPYINYGRSVGDENVFANELGIPALVLGPEGGNIHSPNEWVSAESLGQAVSVYDSLFEKYFRQLSSLA
ncbi:acetylornithine deacetylase/succinyl-diaminopimelate desuccinylase-like protein [Mycobacterium sp. BK086]|uniref:M20 family metallopeptidase n=1 Tax=Mycobacterium sp. BK086 TaxID=2512165 RepID=UPI001061EB1A|nr:M20/M25/M40 family metallo-hydrolase [Mycobacterium sp. BK086]TDO06522.1 acetylornithine deacetylase/succinyl-diaminopimelate desuccinylase-like protein [Mycobacterium sp. BK086]